MQFFIAQPDCVIADRIHQLNCRNEGIPFERAFEYADFYRAAIGDIDTGMRISALASL